MIWLVMFLVSVVAWLTVASFNRPKNYPPGPWRIPVVGQALAMDRRQPHKSLDHWAGKFGPVYSVKLGAQEMVVLSSPKLIKEAFNKTDFNGRPSLHMIKVSNQGHYGLASSNGKLWEENRRFTLRHLRDLGVGRSAIEGSIRDEIKELINKEFLPNLGQPIEISPNLLVSFLNVIWAVVAGERLSYADKRIKYFVDSIDDNFRTVIKVAVLDYFPWLEYFIPKDRLPMKNYLEFSNNFKSFGKKLLDEHKDSYDEAHMRDYIDWYIKQMEVDKDNPQPNFFEWQLLSNINDMFSAGGETAATTIRWALLFLCLHPENQDRIQAEIDEMVGKSRMPEYKDREGMPYTEAFIAETQRLANISPMGGPHSTERDTAIAGYSIPKGTQIIGLLYRVHRDPSLWKDPEQFLPSRFLNYQQQFSTNENLMPFSAGRRQCMGEILAKMELFLFLTSFLQQFRFRFPEDEPVDAEPSSEPRFVLEPKAYRLIVTRRE